MGALATYWKAATMSQTPITTQVHQPLYIHSSIAPQITFDKIVAINDFPNLNDLGISQIINSPLPWDRSSITNFLGLGAPNTKYIRQSDLNTFVCRNVYAGNSCHVQPSNFKANKYRPQGHPRNAQSAPVKVRDY
jgi:hypothetical protein